MSVPRSAKLLLAGATGLVGGLALTALLAADRRRHWQIYAPTRRALSLTHPRLHPIEIDPGTPAGQAQIERVLVAQGVRLDCFVCAIGSTRKAAGSQSAFAAIDRDLVLALASIARRHGARQAIVVSSVGAASASPSFYLRVKGEMEAGIEKLGFERADFLQPGLLLGERAGVSRPGERIAQVLNPLFNPFLLGSLRRYRAIPAEKVAAAQVALAGRKGSGVTRLTNAAIEDCAR